MNSLRCAFAAFLLFVFVIVFSATVIALGIWITNIALPQAFGKEFGDWDKEQDARVLQWFRTLMQPDHPQISCCGEADAYEADIFEREGDHYVAVITAHRGPTAVPVGTRIEVPNYKLKYDQGNPTGHGIIFLSSAGAVFCYVTPGGI